jgi:predicted secreted protein
MWLYWRKKRKKIIQKDKREQTRDQKMANKNWKQ